MEILLTFIVMIALITGAVIYSTFSWGYVCFKFWYWFILPIFPDLPHLDFWQCIGIMFFISLFKTASSSTSNSKTEEDKYSNAIGLMLNPWILLLVASFFK